MKQHTKIAVLVINCLQGGGAERFVLTLGQGFYELGYEVHILRLKPLVEYDLNPNLIYHLLRFKPYKLIPGAQRRNKIFARAVDNYILSKIGHPDIVLSNLERSDNIFRYSQLPNIVYVIHNTLSLYYKFDQAADIDHLKSKLRDIYSKHPCVCVSEGVADDLKAILGSQVTSTTIYNAFDKILIDQLADEPLSSPHGGVKPNQYLLHVGSFKYQKAHDVLLNAYAKSSMHYPLVLLGQGQLFNKTKALAKNLGIGDKVIFLGFNKNPYPYIKHARGLVLSSRFEGFGRVIAEALALSTPVVSTNCPSGPSELLPAENLVPVDDVTVLAAKMTALMANPQAFTVNFDDQFLPIEIAKKYLAFVQESFHPNISNPSPSHQGSSN